MNTAIVLGVAIDPIGWLPAVIALFLVYIAARALVFLLRSRPL